jgi:Na+/melibiose symporter-like transporter
VAACAAEIAGGHPAAGSLGLAVGCTLFVGWTLSRIGDFSRLSARPNSTALLISFRPAWLAAGILIAGFFVGVVGPVAFKVR